MSEYQGYDAILVRGTPRYRFNKKMVPTAQVPEQIRMALEFDLKKASMPVQPTVIPVATEAGIEPIPPIPPAELNLQPPVSNAHVAEGAELFPPDVVSSDMPSEHEIELIKQIEDVKAQLAERPHDASLANVSLEDLAKEMRQRFGIYSVFSGSEPKPGDAHPFTGKPMNRYELGLAYSAYTAALAQGRLKVDYLEQADRARQSAAAVTEHRGEMDRRMVEPAFDSPKYESFAERTSVEGQKRQSSTRTVFRPNDPISEDVTAEPNVRGTTIREQW